MTTDDFTRAAAAELLGLRDARGGWGYRAGHAPASEPTALAGLALCAASGGTSPHADAAREAADRLASAQAADGSVGVSASTPAPGWATPWALLLWAAVGGHDAPARAAARWLLAEKGRALPRREEPRRVAGHDTSLVGWPWVADTHSWLEPTAAAVLALGRAGLAGHARVREGLRLIDDRAVPSGGWNYGNKAVFGRALRAQPAPTGLALLALAGTGPRSAAVDGGIDYLRRALPGVRASSSLGWGLVGLRAWGARPAPAAGWLSEAYAGVTGRPDAAPRLACLLLAAGEGTLGLFGKAVGEGTSGGAA